MNGEVRQRRPQGEKKTDDIKHSQTEVERIVSKGWVLRVVMYCCVASWFALFVLLILIPSPINPESYEVSDPVELSDVIEVSDALKNAERLFEGELHGPESIAINGDYIYTSSSDGWVKVIHKGEVKNLVTFGRQPCGSIEHETTCGRPLGMRMHKDGHLVVTDAYYGLFKVNVTTGDYVTLFSSATPLDGKPVKITNDMDFGADGKIYFSHTTTRFDRNELQYLFTECGANGRLLMYDPKTKDVTVLVDDLRFANGVQMSKDKSAVLVVESLAARVTRYDLKSGKTSIWADNLPCASDNIRYNKYTGTYWVGCAFVRRKGRYLVDMLAPYPWLRAQIAKFATFNAFISWVQFNRWLNPGTLTVELDESGKMIRILMDTRGETGLHHISEVEAGDGVLYFGSFQGSFLARMFTKDIPGL